MIINIILFGYVIPTLLSIIIRFCAGLTSDFNDSFYSHEITYKLCCAPIINICIVLFTIVILLSGLYFKIEDIILWGYKNLKYNKFLQNKDSNMENKVSMSDVRTFHELSNKFEKYIHKYMEVTYQHLSEYWVMGWCITDKLVEITFYNFDADTDEILEIDVNEFLDWCNNH